MKFMGGAVAGLVAALVGCVSTDAVTCSDGTTCPGGTTCVALTAPDETLCATPSQIAACAGVAEGSACAAGWCHDTACLPIACGNGRLDLGETCDDANTVAGDGCSSDCSSDETCGNGKLDPLTIVNGDVVANEQCDDGNLASGDGCSSRCENEVPHWEQIDGTPLPPLYAAAAAWDPARDRLVLFGGGPDASIEDAAADTTSEWNGAYWIQQSSLLRPPPRYGEALAYDGVNRRMMMFGGQAGDDKAPLGDQWEWDGTEWTPQISTTMPSARTHFAMAYDSARKKVVLYGGFGFFNGVPETSLADTWEWDGATWTQIATTSSPGPRYGYAMAYDPKRGMTVLIGGTYQPNGSPIVRPRDTWGWDGTTWTQLNTTTPVELDGGASAAFDASRGQIVAYGGFNTVPAATMYAFDGTHWNDLSSSTPGPRQAAILAASPRAGSLVLFGGISSGVTLDGSTWIWHGGAWTQAATSEPVGPRAIGFGAYDRRHGIVWIFGGQDGAGGQTNELWKFDGETWAQVAFTGGPSARTAAALAYDEARDRLVVFGGGVSDGSGGTVEVPADTWLWDGTTWTQAQPVTLPSARYGGEMVYDAKRGRVVLFGGAQAPTTMGGQSTILNDTWEWDGTTWIETATTGAVPSPRFIPEMAYDPIRNVTWLSGGFAVLNVLSDLWSYDGTSWTQVTPTIGLAARLAPAFGYDPSNGAVIAFSGASLANPAAFDDTWQLDGTTWRLLTPENSPPAREGGLGFPEPNGRGLMVLSGQASVGSNPVPIGDKWRLRYSSAGATEELCGIDMDNDGDGLAGCADPDCWATCTPFCPPGVSCPASAPRCGDGTCDPRETCRNCPMDCGTCTAICGDTFCDSPETMASCPGDCPQ